MKNKKLSDFQQKDYIATGGVSCPFCGSYAIEGGHFETDAGAAWQPVKCNMCGEHWDDLYSLNGIEHRPEKVTRTIKTKQRKGGPDREL